MLSSTANKVRGNSVCACTDTVSWVPSTGLVSDTYQFILLRNNYLEPGLPCVLFTLWSLHARPCKIAGHALRVVLQSLAVSSHPSIMHASGGLGHASVYPSTIICPRIHVHDNDFIDTVGWAVKPGLHIYSEASARPNLSPDQWKRSSGIDTGAKWSTTHVPLLNIELLLLDRSAKASLLRSCLVLHDKLSCSNEFYWVVYEINASYPRRECTQKTDYWLVLMDYGLGVRTLSSSQKRRPVWDYVRKFLHFLIELYMCRASDKIPV